jgi:signal transduction histidine kinase
LENFTSSKLFSINQAFENTTEETNNILSKILSDLVDLGFHSTRFYLLIENGGEVGDSVFQLASSHYRDSSFVAPKAYRIEFSKTTIFRTNNISQGYSIGSDESHSDVAWPEQLAIKGTNWIDLLVISPVNQEIYGLLAVSWTGSAQLLDEDALAALRLLSVRIGTWMASQTVKTHHQLETLEHGLDLDQGGELSINSLIGITKFISESFMTNMVSCFKYDWYCGKLNKILEDIDNKIGEIVDYEESYSRNHFLTGRAFIDKKFRYIPDFELFLSNNMQKIDIKSLNEHQARIGHISSCMYCLVEFGKHSYLFRIFRSLESNYGIYSKRDRDNLIGSAEQLSLVLERKVRQFQQLRIKAAATDSFSKMVSGTHTDFHEFGALTEYLTNSGLQNFLLCTNGGNDRDADIVFASGDLAAVSNNASWPTSELNMVVERNQNFLSTEVIDLLGPGSAAARRVNIRRELGNPKLSHILLLAVSSPTSVTTLVLSREDSERGADAISRVGMEKNEEAFLASLLSICSSAKIARQMLISSDLADQILADIGHEVGTPVAILTQTAILACNEAIALVREIGRAAKDTLGADSASIAIELDNLRQGLKHKQRSLQFRRSEVNDAGDLVQVVTEVPRVLAQIGSSSTALDIRQHEWTAFLKEVWHDSLVWSAVLDEGAFQTGRMSRGYFKLNATEGSQDLNFIGDRSTLRMAIGNVIRNAMKYSLPRYSGEPMIISVDASYTSTRFSVKVTNWGVGIPKEKRKIIFNKYERLDRKDRKRIIRGRGIGLYLAKTFFNANNGDISCLDSVATLNDRERSTVMLEGYETTFGMWIPSVGTLGRRSVKV